MVELDKILSERSDERILRSIKEIPDSEFAKLAEAILNYLELKLVRSKPKGGFYMAECVHRPDGKKYVVFISRRDDVITKADIESLVQYMVRAESPNGLILTTSSVAQDAVPYADEKNVGLADSAKLAALLRRFDLDKEVIKAAEVARERAKLAAIPGADKDLAETMRLGYESLGSKDYMKALEHFDRAIAMKGDYDVPWRMKGNALDEMGYHEQALECYKHALELFPESDETWFSLGNCLFALGRYAEEIICYDRALQYNPTLQKALINKGSTLHRLGRFKEALETYNKVLKINYRLEKVHNNRGATLHAMGQPNEALAAYNRAIELKREYVEAWMNKGSLLYEMGKYPEALEAFNQMVQIRPEVPKGWYLRGLAARKNGNVSLAKASFEAALRLDHEYADARRALEDVSKKIAEKFVEAPKIVQDILTSEAFKVTETKPPQREIPKLGEDVLARVREEKVEELAEEIYGDRAELLFLLGRMDEAFDYLGKSLRLEGEDASLLTQAGNVLSGLGKMDSAIKSYEHALMADPFYKPAMLNLHSLLLQEGEVERAMKLSESLRRSTYGWQARGVAALGAHMSGDDKQALEDIDAALNVEDISALRNLKGVIKLKGGDMNGAEESFDKTKDLPLDPAESFNNSGVVFLENKEPERASTEFDKAIRVQRNNQAAWNNRGCVLYAVDRLREAIACFEESSVMNPSAASLSNKGFCQLSLDLLPDALKSFDLSIRVAETAEAFNNKGITLERLGKKNEAQVAFKEALRLAPGFKDAQENLKRLASESPRPEPKPAPTPPPEEEIIGDRETAPSKLATLDEPAIRGMRKSELEALLASLGLDPAGRRGELIERVLKAKAAEKK